MHEPCSQVLTERHHPNCSLAQLTNSHTQRAAELSELERSHALTSTSIYAERSVIPRLYKVRVPRREKAGLFFMYLLPSHIDSRYMRVRVKVGRYESSRNHPRTRESGKKWW